MNKEEVILKKWNGLILVFVLILSLVQPHVGYAEDSLVLNGKVSGQIADETNRQVFKIELTQKGLLFIDLKSWIDVVEYRVFDESGEEFTNRYVYSDPVTPKTDTVYYDLEVGTYYVELEQYSKGTNGKFEISTLFTPYNTNDIEPNNGTEQAQNLSFNKKTKGFISRQDENDVYQVKLRRAGRLEIDFTSLIFTHAEFYLTDEFGKLIDRQTVNSEWKTPGVYKKSVDLEPGTYYIEIESWDAPRMTGTYELFAKFQAANNQEKESNNGITEAMPLAFYRPLTGFLAWNDIQDFYKIVLPKASKVTLDAQLYVNNNTDVEVYDQRFNQVHYNQVTSSSTTPKRYTESFALKAGTYYVAIKAWDERRDTGKYVLQVKSSHLLPPLTVNTVTTKSTAITGKTEKNAVVSFKVGKKTYTRKADSKGNYSFKISKQKAGSIINVSTKNKYGTTAKRIAVKK